MTAQVTVEILQVLHVSTDLFLWMKHLPVQTLDRNQPVLNVDRP